MQAPRAESLPRQSTVADGAALRTLLVGLASRRLLLLGVVLLGLGLRLRGLGEQSMARDELISVDLALMPLGDLLAALPSFGANNASYYLFLHGWLRVWGATPPDELVRLPSLLFGLLEIGLLYLLGTRLFGPRCGLWAAFVAAVNPYQVAWSQTARGYTLWALFAALSYLTLFRALDSRERRAWLTWALITLLTLLTHLYTAFLLAAQALTILVLGGPKVLARLALWGGLAALVASPLVLYIAYENRELWQLEYVSRTNWQDVWRLLWSYTGSYRAIPLYAALLVAGAASVVKGWRTAPAERARAGAIWLWLLLPPALVFAITLTLKPILVDRFLFGVHPALCLLTGLGLARLPRLLAAPAGLGLLVVAGLALSSAFTVLPSKEWRETYQYMIQQARADDGYIFIAPTNFQAWRYYAPRLGQDPWAIDAIQTAEIYEAPRRTLSFNQAELDRFAARHPRIWLILSDEFDPELAQDAGGDTSAWVKQRLTRTGYAARQRAFHEVRLLLYEKRT